MSDGEAKGVKLETWLLVGFLTAMLLSTTVIVLTSANKTTVDDHRILNEFGYDDKQIVEITSVVAAFNWANIIADALGTDMEA